MDVIIRPGADDATSLVAEIIAGELRNKPKLVLGLATGCTMEAVYARLVRLHRALCLFFSHASTLNFAKYVGLSGDHSKSYRNNMDHHRFLAVNIGRHNTHVPEGA